MKYYRTVVSNRRGSRDWQSARLHLILNIATCVIRVSYAWNGSKRQSEREENRTSCESKAESGCLVSHVAKSLSELTRRTSAREKSALQYFLLPTRSKTSRIGLASGFCTRALEPSWRHV